MAEVPCTFVGPLQDGDTTVHGMDCPDVQFWMGVAMFGVLVICIGMVFAGIDAFFAAGALLM